MIQTKLATNKVWSCNHIFMIYKTYTCNFLQIFITIEANADSPNLKKDFFINNIIMNFLGRQVLEHPGFIDLSDFNNKFGNYKYIRTYTLKYELIFHLLTQHTN